MSLRVPILETARLRLHEVTEANLPAYKKHFVDYEVIQHLAAAVPWPYPKDGVESFLHSIEAELGVSRWLWGIFRKSHPHELIGVVDLWREGRPENRGFWLGRKFWGNGYMTEATDTVTAHAFTALGFDKLTFANALGNTRSRRVKEKAGAKLVCVKPAKFVNPAYTEHEIWELTKVDWEASSR